MNKERATRFGVNYVPSKKWWYSWIDWDRASIKEDLQAISSLGMDHVRIHCLWPLFQPNPAYVSETALSRLDELLDLADGCGLDVEVTLLDGWLSGFAFFPAWRGSKNIFTDSGVLKAEMFLFKKVAERIGNHPRFLGFDLGNEVNVLSYYGNPITLTEGDTWLSEMMALCEAIAPGKFHVNGVDHGPWFSDNCFSRERLASTGSATSVHAWVEFTGALSRYKPDAVGCTRLTEYCIELAKAYGQPDRLVWLQEFGASKQWMPAEAIPSFAEASIRSALSCQNLWGITWWCSHDLDPLYTDFNILEYDLGLFDHRNRLKPVGQKVADIIAEAHKNPPAPEKRRIAVVLPNNACEGKTETVGWSFAKPYMDLLLQGIRPAVILQSRQEDKSYLATRGITEVI